MTWCWQDDALWQSCTDAAHAQAQAWEARGPEIYQKLRETCVQQPLVALAEEAPSLQHILQQAAALAQQCTRLVVVGIGGASLGAQALVALADDPAKVGFLENCDPATLETFFRMPSASTGWLIISKSGETVETLAAALALAAQHGDDASLPSRVRVVTANPHSALGQLAVRQGWQVLAHPADLGGRFSVFSIVALLPAAFAGLDVAAIVRAAHASMDRLLQEQDTHLLHHAAWLAANAMDKPMHVLMAYADRLRASTQWFKQLWAESLGKHGVGSTPLTAIGAIDQHSQLQLYLDGPRDKLVTLWLPEHVQDGLRFPDAGIAGLRYLSGHTMGEVMKATAEATATTLMKSGVPIRVARGPLNAQSLAEWFVRQMLETLLVAQLLGVDPYSQPAVEEGKQITRAALAARAS